MLNVTDEPVCDVMWMGLLCKGTAELLQVVLPVVGEGGDSVGVIVGCCGAILLLIGEGVGGGVGAAVGVAVGCLVDGIGVGETVLTGQLLGFGVGFGVMDLTMGMAVGAEVPAGFGV